MAVKKKRHLLIKSFSTKKTYLLTFLKLNKGPNSRARSWVLINWETSYFVYMVT